MINNIKKKLEILSKITIMAISNYEHDECVLFAKVLRSKGILFSKIANETWTPSYSQIQKNKSEGVNRGVPDYLVIVKKKDGTKELVFVEMKRKTGGVVSPQQKTRIQNLTECGINVSVCKGVVEALNFINNIIHNGEKK